MRGAVLCASLVCALSHGGAAAGSGQATPDPGVLTTIRITITAIAGGKPLVPGTYEIRLTADRPSPLAGQPASAQQWVEFVSNGTVVAREVAEVLRDDELPLVGASSRPVPDGTRVEMLKGGEFLRISVKRANERYLIHLPVKQ